MPWHRPAVLLHGEASREGRALGRPGGSLVVIPVPVLRCCLLRPAAVAASPPPPPAPTPPSLLAVRPATAPRQGLGARSPPAASCVAPPVRRQPREDGWMQACPRRPHYRGSAQLRALARRLDPGRSLKRGQPPKIPCRFLSDEVAPTRFIASCLLDLQIYS
jgi:hypothetical protein